MSSSLQKEVLYTQLVALRPTLLQWLSRQSQSSELAEEVLQQGYLQAFEKLHQLKDPRQLTPWFKQILRRKLLDEWRRQSRLTGTSQEMWESLLPPASEALEADVSCACILDLLGHLPPQYAQLLQAVDINEEHIQSLSQRLGLRPNNAYVRLSRARQALRKQLKQQCGTDSVDACQHCACETLNQVH